MAKILMIDDELFYRELVSDILTKAKHEVVQARDGKEALIMLDRYLDLDLVLCDVVMPDMNGLVVLSKVRDKDLTLPVIMLSAYEDQRMVIQALRRGAFDYQKKPISAQELELAVKRGLDYRRLQTEQQKKLTRLASLENGAKRLSGMVVGEVPLAALSQEYELLDSAVAMVAEVLECDRVSIMLLDPDSEKLEVVVAVGMSKTMMKKESRPARKSVSSQVLTTGEALLVTDVVEDERVEANEFSNQYKSASFMIAPLRVGGRIVGTINANDKKDKQPFTEDDLFVLKTLSHHASAALSHAINVTEMKRDRERLKRLAEFQRILIHYLEPEQMLKDLLRKCQEMLNVVSASVFLRDEFSDVLVLKVGYNGAVEIAKEISVPFGQSITGLTAKDGKIFLLNAPAKDRRFIHDLEWPYKGVIRNYLSAPIRISNTNIGVIRLLNRRDGPFIQSDAQLLMDVADSLSIAIRNMKLYEQLNQSVEEIITVNRDLQKANDELLLKAKELDALKKSLAGSKT